MFFRLFLSRTTFIRNNEKVVLTKYGNFTRYIGKWYDWVMQGVGLGIMAISERVISFEWPLGKCTA